MSTAQSLNEKNVLALYSTAGAGDWAGAQALVTEDFVLREPECFPFGGSYRGIASLRAFYSEIFKAAGPTDIAMDAITSGTDHVVVLVTLKMKNHGVEAKVAEAFRLRDGKIAEVTVYYLDAPRVATIYAGVADGIARNFPDVKRIGT